MRSYWIETYGCQMNFAEADALEIELASSGWEKSAKPEDADVVLLHTCSVRQTAEDRIWGRVGYYKHIKQEKPLKLVVMGCMAERLREKITSSAPSVDLVVGNFSKHALVEELDRMVPENRAVPENGQGEAIEKARSNNNVFAKDASVPRGKHNHTDKIRAEENSEFRFAPLHVKNDAYHSYIPIMHGCNNYCTYCIVPYVRGREISRPPEALIAEIRKAEETGTREITLLGQNVNSYRYENDEGVVMFSELLSMILAHTGSIEWVRFITSHPKDVSPRLIELMASEEKLCAHFHLPVQHASDRILKAMNRKYTRKEFLELVERLRDAVPDIALTTDILVGFPGEEEEDVEALLELIRRVQFDDAFMYYFNPREGTPAARFDTQVEHERKLRRLSEIIALQRSITLEKRRSRLGSTDMVMVDAVSKKNPEELRGHSERDEAVVFRSDPEIIGSIVPVHLDELAGTTYRGQYSGGR